MYKDYLAIHLEYSSLSKLDAYKSKRALVAFLNEGERYSCNHSLSVVGATVKLMPHSDGGWRDRYTN